MNRKFFALATLLTLLALLLSVPGTLAQEPEPPCPVKPVSSSPQLPDGGPRRAPDGTWYMPAGAVRPEGSSATMSPQDTGGPDDFGYTWDDSVALSWISASGGTNTGMTGDSWDQATGPITLPFSFKYYENTYTQAYIAAAGYVAFTQADFWDDQDDIPAPSVPNNVIAPFWTPIYIGGGGWVRYLSGGTAPNRYFVVEWHDVKGGDPGDSIGGDETYRFEVILHENGDIVFQYQAMSYGGSSYWCGAAGIEDSGGVDGLNYVDFCDQAPSNRAVRFYRPAPSARVSIRPLHQGRFAHGGKTASFEVTIRNNGELGADTYDLTIFSTWPATLYAADGTTPLVDTDSDSTIDTGSVAQGGSSTVVVKVATPAVANVGDDNTAAITVRSSLDVGKSKTVDLRTAVPAPFAQVYRDDADGAMSLDLVQPDGQTRVKTTSNYHWGYDMAVAEMPSSFAYVWRKSRSVGSLWVSELEYTLRDSSGNTLRGVSKLTDHSGATVRTYDYDPAVAVAPNGRIGVLWYRYLWNSNTGQSNYNIYFAILDSSGNLAYGPVNLTNNSAWGTWSDLNVPRTYSPRIAATGDNRFVLAWEREMRTSGGWLEDVYYVVRDANGNAIKGVTQFTSGVADEDYYETPALATLSGNRALLAYYGPNGISYAVLDSAGSTVKGETNTGGWGRNPDVVQISDGKTVIAWSDWDDDINFAVLDSTTYNVTYGPDWLDNPAAATGDGYVSVAADAAGHAILTWMDYAWNSRLNLYYALVDGNGTVLTDPMIFRTSQATDPRIESSFEGYGNTSYSLVTPSADVDGWVTTPSLVGAAPEGKAGIGASFGNNGSTQATSVVLTATLDSNLTYASASPAPASASGGTVVWNLPDMDFLGNGHVVLYTDVPSATIGTRYPVTWTIASAGTEHDSSDNTAAAEVMVSEQVFLPLVTRNY